MALVAYGNSDSSDYEDDDIDINIANLPNNINLDQGESKIYGEQSSVDNEKITHNEQEESLFNELPLPTSGKTTIVEEDDEFLHKKVSPAMAMKQKPKIMIPSLNDFKDVENTIPTAKPKTTNSKKSGLLNILPQPKNGLTSTSNFIPNVLTQKTHTSSVKKKESLPLPKVASKLTSIVTEYSDDSDDEVQNDFFSINKPVEVIQDDVPFDAENNSNNVNQPSSTRNNTPRSIESYFKKGEDNVLLPHENEDINLVPIQTSNIQESTSNEIVLDEEAILKLCGSRGKRKREEIQIVDVNQQEVLNDARQMLLKGLMEDTSKRQSASKKRGNEPTSQQRRKHQITYLAHQAKANEIELQNQWATNRMTKRKTQSKYGF